MKHTRFAMMIATGLVALGTMSPVRAQSAITIGYVDMEKAFNGAESRKSGDDKVQNLIRNLQEREASLRDATMLSPKTWQDYKALVEKDKPTAQDTAAIAGIRDQLSKLDTELKSLQQTPQLTDAQKARLNELNGNITANQGNFQSVDADYLQQLNKLRDDLKTSIIKDIQAAAADVAKARNVSVVLNKQLDPEDPATILVIAGGVDLTDDVIKQVNQKK